MDEPTLELEDIQGHIVPGFGATHTAVVVLRIDDDAGARQELAKLVSHVTTAQRGLELKAARRHAAIHARPAPTQGEASLAMGFSAAAVWRWAAETAGFDRYFLQGMRNDARALGDPVGSDSIPIDWIFNTTEDSRADVVLVVGHSSSQQLQDVLHRWVTALKPHLSVTSLQCGRRREGDREFFGFTDGVSQPAPRGKDSDDVFISRRLLDPSDPHFNTYARPGQQLIWPGAFLFGYPGQTSAFPAPGPVMNAPAPWMRNGSYLVYRRLRQDIGAFRMVVSTLTGFLNDRGHDVAEDWLAARLVGRWPDGTPLVASPDRPDPEISGNRDRINNFKFSSGTPSFLLADSHQTTPTVPADLVGMKCPQAAHVRQVNPRDGFSEIGAENHPRKLMLRRGITYGPEPEVGDEEDRGLLFLSYQTSIEDQFRFVQIDWANGAHRPTGDGRDPIIGQDGTSSPSRLISMFVPDRTKPQCPMNGRWVIPTGGEYFVVPSISGIRSLLAGAASS